MCKVGRAMSVSPFGGGLRGRASRLRSMTSACLLFLSPQLFAQQTVLDTNYFNRSEHHFTSCTDNNIPSYVLSEANRLTIGDTWKLSYCLFDPIDLENGTKVYLFAISDTKSTTAPKDMSYYLSAKFLDGYLSYKIIDKGNPSFTTWVKSHYAELSDRRFLSLYDQNGPVGTADLFDPKPIELFLNVKVPMDQPDLPILILPPYTPYEIPPWGYIWQLPENLTLTVGFIQPKKKKQEETPFDVQGFLKGTADRQFYSVLLSIPYLASKAKGSPVENSLYQLSRKALGCRVKEINGKLKKELKDG